MVGSIEHRTSNNVGPEFEAEDEILLATVLPAGPHTWTGPLGLDTPGTTVSFKVFTLTAEGNQRGSNEVTITRPAALPPPPCGGREVPEPRDLPRDPLPRDIG